MKNMRRMGMALWMVVGLSASTGMVMASDIEKEQRWADQVIGDLFDGEPVMLKAGSGEFLSLYTEADEAKDTAVVVMHGLGIHPDWPTVINPLRVELAAMGWPTLSIQMPILPNEAEGSEYAKLMPEVAPRIHAAVDYLTQTSAKKVVLIAHSMGARMTAYALSNDATLAPKAIAVAMIGMSEGNESALKTIQLPMLDLYGSNDNEGVLASVDSRKAAQSHNAKYQQKMVPEAEHFFEGFEEALVEAVSSWITNL